MSNDGKKRGLGRGLAALLADTSGELPLASNSEHEAAAQAGQRAGGQQAGGLHAGGVQMVAVESLRPNPHQPRSRFDEAALAELAESIRVHGVIQPLVVTAAEAPAGQEAAQKAGHESAYYIVAGERRWRAAKVAGLESVPVVLREASPRQLMELALVENVQREDLSPLEEAAAYAALIEEHGLTQAEVAERVGKSRPAVANTLRLLNLPLEAQQAVTDERISAGHARALLALPDAALMRAALEEVLRRDLSVRQTEALVKRLLEAPAPVAEPKPADPKLAAHVVELEDRFRRAFSTKVNLHRNDDGSGRLVVHFFSDEDLDAIYRLITPGDESDDL